MLLKSIWSIWITVPQYMLVLMLLNCMTYFTPIYNACICICVWNWLIIYGYAWCLFYLVAQIASWNDFVLIFSELNKSLLYLITHCTWYTVFLPFLLLFYWYAYVWTCSLLLVQIALCMHLITHYTIGRLFFLPCALLFYCIACVWICSLCYFLIYKLHFVILCQFCFKTGHSILSCSAQTSIACLSNTYNCMLIFPNTFST